MLPTNTSDSRFRVGFPARKHASLLLAALMLLIVGLLGTQTAHSGTAASTANSLFVREYPIPTANGSPQNITVEAPGRVWFTMPMANKIGRLVVNSPTDYQFTEKAVPTANSYPYDLVYHDGAVWFTERDGNKIGRLDTTTLTIVEYVIDTQDSQPLGVDVAPDGNVWFVENNANKVARFDPVAEVFHEYPYPTANADLEAVSVAAIGELWLTAPALNEVSRFRESDGSFLQIPVADFGGSPFPPGDIATDNSGMPWITAPTKDLVGRFAPGTLAYWHWETLPAGRQPTGITTSVRDGYTVVWVAETGAGWVAQIGTSPTLGTLFHWETALPTPNSLPRAIAVDAEGHAWITETDSHQIAEWVPPYQRFTHLPAVTK